MATFLNYSAGSRLRAQLLESLIVEIRFANEDCRNALGEADHAIATNRLKNALQVFDDLVVQR